MVLLAETYLSQKRLSRVEKEFIKHLGVSRISFVEQILLPFGESSSMQEKGQ